ncbi:MAG: 6-pyruvoyl trahydropterin synthase family protein [Planctomycetota bacterium]
MQIEKTYKFYAAHRNEELDDKCRNLHGHRYGLRCIFSVQRQGSISTLFGDFDALVEPMLRRDYDHSLLIHLRDPLYPVLLEYMSRSGDELKLKVLDGPTSVENLARQLFGEISSLGFDLDRLEVQETDTSTVVYTRADWMAESASTTSRATMMAGSPAN